MKKMARFPDDGDEELPFEPLTAEQARRLRELNPPVSPWRVIVGQGVVGLVTALAAWGLTGRQDVGWSAAYGAMAVVIPAAIFARGLTWRFSSRSAKGAAAGFMVWELVKIALTVAILVAAPRWVEALSWPALLAGMVLTFKVYWVALAVSPRRARPANGN